ncbi:MAG TPA: biotin--[acetyl-CoA-carboxylase] ligase [Aldersonia sp.]
MFTDLDRPPLNAAELSRGLNFYASVDVVDRTGSTNADLLERAADPTVDRAVLFAEFQERGRGRHSRTWEAPPQAHIAVSVLLRAPGVDPGTLGWLPLLTGIAIVDALREVAKVDAELKWPNDVLVGGRKVAGILAEVSWPKPADADTGPAVVVGVGLNVSLTEEELPVPQATSLALLGAEVTDRTTIARAMLRALAERWRAWEAAGWATTDLAAAYRERCVTLGARVRADLPGGAAVEGTARDIDADGRLLIVREDRDEIAVAAGDVTHLRGA